MSFALSIFVVLYCASCSSSPSTDPNHIVVWAWPGALQALEAGYDAFREAYPDIDVEFVEIPWAGGGLPTKLQVTIMARSGAPDVTGLMNVSAPAFVNYGALWDITDRLGDKRNDYPDYKLQECTDPEGRLRAVPWDIAPTGLFYRKDIFDRYGEPVPQTWDEFLELGDRMLKRGHYMVKLSNVFDGATQETFEFLLRQQGGQYFSANGDVSINSPAAVNAMELLLRVRETGISTDAGAGAAEWGLYKSGKIICRIFPAYYTNILPDYVGTRPEDGFGQWRAALLPAFMPGGARASSGVCSVLGIPVQSEKKEAAWKYVHFMAATIEGARTQTEYGGLAAYMPSLQIPEIVEYKHPFFGGQQVNKLFLELNSHVQVGFSTHPCIEEARRILRGEFEQVWQGEREIEGALARAEARIIKAKREYE